MYQFFVIFIVLPLLAIACVGGAVVFAYGSIVCGAYAGVGFYLSVRDDANGENWETKDTEDIWEYILMLYLTPYVAVVATPILAVIGSRLVGGGDLGMIVGCWLLAFGFAFARFSQKCWNKPMIKVSLPFLPSKRIVLERGGVGEEIMAAELIWTKARFQMWWDGLYIRAWLFLLSIVGRFRAWLES